MNVQRMLVLSAAVGLAQFAGTGLAFDIASLSAVRATMDFCAGVNPAGAASYKEIAALAVPEVAEEELSRLESTEEYKAAYDDFAAKLEDFSDEDAAEACHSFLKPVNAT